MPSTYSPTLRVELIGSGEQDSTWGLTTNSNLGTILEQAITGVETITMVDADYTLTTYNGLPDEARNAVLVISGANTAARNVIAPAVEKIYIVRNSTTGGFAITVKTPSGAGITIPNGATQTVYCNGTDFFLASGVVAGTGITVSGATVALANTAVTPGTYAAATVTVDQQGRLTAASQTILGTMATQNANSVAVTGGTVANTTISGGTVNSLTTASLGTNAYGTKTVSTSSPTGGSDGDIWYKV